MAVKGRATNQLHVVSTTDADTLTQFVKKHADKNAMVFTDESPVYDALNRAHSTVKEAVNGIVHTNGIESHWELLKRGYHGVYHHSSFKHLQRYVDEFGGRLNIRSLDSTQQTGFLVRNGVGKALTFATLIGPKHPRQPVLIKSWE